jgi:hypothetical protein
LITYIFTTCYGAELDVIDDGLNKVNWRVDSVATQLAEMQKKIDAGYVVKSVTPKPNNGKDGFEIIVEGNGGQQTWWIYGGADGAPGANGHDGATWSIGPLGTWVRTDFNGTSVDSKIPAAGNKSPEVKEGYWVLYSWNTDCECYLEIKTGYKADSLSTYVVDFPEYYELWVPVQLKDGSDELLFNPDGTPVCKYETITLPKWLQTAKEPIYFRILGYATLAGADTLKIIENDLSLKYWYVNLHNRTEDTVVTQEDEIWKWTLKPAPPYMLTGEYIIPQLQDETIAVVFSLNRPQSYINSLNLSNLGLYDSKDRKLELVSFDQPVLLDRLLTKGGSNGDTIYYARMRNISIPYPPIQPSAVPKGRIYYRLALEDSVRSELAASTIEFSRYTPETGEVPATYSVSGGTFLLPDSFLVQALPATDRNVRIQTSPAADTSKIYGYYIDSLKGGGHLRRVTIIGDPPSFQVDSPATGEPDYGFSLGVYKLQMNGSIYIDTIKIKAVP